MEFGFNSARLAPGDRRRHYGLIIYDVLSSADDSRPTSLILSTTLVVQVKQSVACVCLSVRLDFLTFDLDIWRSVWSIAVCHTDLGRNRFAKLVSDSSPKPVSDSADKSITLGSLCSTGRQVRCDKVFL